VIERKSWGIVNQYMAARFVTIDYDTPLILPPNLRDWVPAGHLAHFILDAVEEMDLHQVRVNERGTGSEQYPPRMLLALLLYCYATGVFSSRRIEQATFDSVPVRLISGDTHPDHDTICTFRRENPALLAEAFVRVLELAQALKFLQVGQITVAVDGTKVLANASKHAAVSYEHAGKTIQQLELEVKELLAKAEQADSRPLEEGLTIPQEVQRRQERKAKLATARAEIEARAKARAAAEMAEYQAKLAERAAQKEAGRKPRGPDPKIPSQQPKPSDQYNFTDPESRIMKAGNGQHFEQSYNAQAAVEVDSRLIVGDRVSPAPNDKQELVPNLAAIAQPVASVAAVLIDSGFYSEAAVQAVEQTGLGQPTGTIVYAAVEKREHHRTVSDLEQKPEPEVPGPEATPSQRMNYRLRTPEGRAKYKLRQQTVEPVFGIIKSVLGFRQFLLRGLAKVGLEWRWVCLAYNLKRLHILSAGLKIGTGS
jgi:transposase